MTPLKSETLPKQEVPKSYFQLKGVNLSSRGNRNNHRRCSVKKGVLENFTNFTGKLLCWSLFLIKLQVCVVPQEVFMKAYEGL